MAAETFSLAVKAHQAGDIVVAEKIYRLVLVEDPAHLGALELLGVAHYQQDQPEHSITLITRAIAGRSDIASFQSNLAPPLMDLGEHRAAQRPAQRAIVIDPMLATAYVNLSFSEDALGVSRDAITNAARAICIDPSLGAARSALASALHKTGDTQRAITAAQQALILTPGNSKVIHLLGLIFRDSAAKGAAKFLARSVEIAPQKTSFIANFAQIHRFFVGDPWINVIRKNTHHADQLSDLARSDLYFALAKIDADLGNLPAAFDHLVAANSLKRRHVLYDEAAILGLFPRIKAIFSEAYCRALPTTGVTDDPHIFILGLPRSGTTLVEQILANHPAVYGAGELKGFSQAISEVMGTTGFPEATAELTELSRNRLAALYRQKLPDYDGSFSRITDKMPANLLFAGLIHEVLPSAKIILVRRNPVDTCLSCFSTNFTDSLNYTYDLGELGRYAAASIDLMDHWEKVLRPSALLAVHYEQLVAAPEENARRLLEFLGLPWDPLVLEFHRSKRPVRTASVTQVRQPIHTKSVGKWRPSDDIISPLLAALKPGAASRAP